MHSALADLRFQYIVTAYSKAHYCSQQAKSTSSRHPFPLNGEFHGGAK